VTGGARNKRRGYEHEAETVAALVAAGLDARRVFGSGAYKQQLGPDFAGDVVVEGLRLECKRRKNGFGRIYEAFDQHDSDLVAARADRRPRLWICTEPLAIELLKYRSAVNSGALLPPVPTNLAPYGEKP